MALSLAATACSVRDAADVASRWAGRGQEAVHGVAVALSQSPAAVPAAVPSDCASQLPPSGAPAFVNPAMLKRTAFVCHAAYAVLHSGLTRTPLWSAEALDPARLAAARGLRRIDVFHPEPSLPAADRAELPDYVHSGYDRGHLAPSADMPTQAAQSESFSLANIAPQAPRLNRGAWEQLERSVRQRAAASPLFVITGLAFHGESIGFLRGRVAVPTQFYKLVYDAAAREAVVFVAPNDDLGEVEPMDVASFEAAFGIHFNLGDVAFLSLAVARNIRR